jgi:hypothetical protein
MSETIIIGFNDDTRTFILSKDIFKTYPKSIFNTLTSSNEILTLKEITYEQFQIIYDVIMKKTKQWLVPPEILKYMGKYGLVDEALFALHIHLNIKTNTECLKIENFKNNNTKMLLSKNFEEYNIYKKLFENDKNIMSMQLTFGCNKLICINILESIPIYYYNVENEQTFTIKNIPIMNEIDINSLRYDIIVDNLGCKNCKLCNECKPLLRINEDCCTPGKCCSDYTGYVDDNGDTEKKKLMDNTIYTKNMAEYFTHLHKILFDDLMYIEILSQKIKSNEKNIINLDDVSEFFSNNIHGSLEKIVNTILKNEGDIINYYNDKLQSYFLVDDNYYFDSQTFNPLRTYFGFINIGSIIQ